MRLRGTRATVAAVSVVLALGAVVSPPRALAAAATSAIEVEPGETEGTISPSVMGSAYLPPFGGMGSFDSATDSFVPGFVSDLQNQVYTGSLRWPGGITSQYYDWTRAVGPQAQRTDSPFGPTSGPSPSTVGPDEFGQLLDATGAAGVSTVNFATGTPQGAAGFVQYMTGAAGSSGPANERAQNGHAQPYNVPVWEVGNEEYTTASSWRAGTAGTVGPGGTACTVDLATCQYIYGGSASFTNQAVVGYADRTAAAANSAGTAGQSFYVAYPPIQAGSQTIYVNGQAWTPVASLTGVGSAAHDYTVDDSTGQISFGDGVNGAIPPSGQKITATYVSGPHSGFLDFYAAMKAANPNIQVCSTDTADAFIQAMGANLAYDCFQVHPYVGGNNAAADISTFENSVMSLPDTESANVEAWESEIRSDAGHSIPLVLTEYGSLISAAPDPTDHPYYLDSLDAALLNASQLADWIGDGIQVADRQLLSAELPAPNAVTTGLPNAAPYAVTGAIVTPGPNTGSNTIVEPTGQYFQLFKPLAGGTLLGATTSNNPTLSGTSTGALSVTAGRGVDGSTDVVVINRDPNSPVSSTLGIDGTTGAGTATLTTLNAAAGGSALSYNTESDPNAVTTTTASTPVSSGAVTVTFPAHSITLVTETTPTASFTAAQVPGSLAVQFTDGSSAIASASITGWSWNFADGTTSTIQSPNHTFGAAGTYPVSLTVTDSNGNEDTFTTNVAVTAPAPSVVTPSVSTPSVSTPTASTVSVPAATVAQSSGNSPKSARPSPPPTTAQIKHQLIKALTPAAKQRSIKKLLSSGSFRTTLVPLERGKLVVDWYAKAGQRRILIAAYRATFANERRVTVRVKLTRQGRRLLRTASRRVAVTADDMFTPKGKRLVKTVKRLTLTRPA
jgi:alpha-N-arabinofuranosidase